MRTPVNRYLLLCFFFLYLPTSSWGWGMLGHRIVGQIADSYLSKKARKEIKAILGNESVAMSANWADFIKSDSTYNYLDTWHYINFPKGLNLAGLQAYVQKDTAASAYKAIEFLKGELKKKEVTLAQKQMYLRLLIHFVGDIHQPMHASPEGTAGGNTVRVAWFSQSSNLHRVWDTHLIEYQQLSYTEHAAAINHTTTAQIKLWQGQSLTECLYESYTISQRLNDEIKEPNARLGYEYNFKHVDLMNEQLLKGGVRLAAVLNEIFG